MKQNLKSVAPLITAFALCTCMLLTLLGCADYGREQSTTTKGYFRVEHLFTHDNVSVYRFMDNGRPCYFTTRGDVTNTREEGRETVTYTTTAGPGTTE